MKALLFIGMIATSAMANADMAPPEYGIVTANNMTCAVLQQKLAEEGALFIATSPNMRGQMYYAGTNSCGIKERAVMTYVRAQDRECAVGYTCAPNGN